ncbi:MAG: TIM barrel protein [Planctomycetota bacterium]
MATLGCVISFGFESMPPDRLLPLWAELGCTTSQFYRNTDQPPDLAEARRMAADAGLPIRSMHGVFGPRIDPSSPRNALRRASVDAYRPELDVAHAVGAVGIVVHPAARNPGDDALAADDRAARRDALLTSLDELADLAQGSGVHIWIENLPLDHLFGTDPAQLAELVAIAQRPELALCFDTGHAHISLDEASDGFADLAPQVACVHVSDNDGDRDAHQFPSDGSIHWPTMGEHLAALPDPVDVCLELFPSPDQLRARLDAGYADTLRQLVMPAATADR